MQEYLAMVNRWRVEAGMNARTAFLKALSCRIDFTGVSSSRCRAFWQLSR